MRRPVKNDISVVESLTPILEITRHVILSAEIAALPPCFGAPGCTDLLVDLGAWQGNSPNAKSSRSM